MEILPKFDYKREKICNFGLKFDRKMANEIY